MVCVSCLSVILSCLFITALWSSAGKRLTSWMFSCVLSLSHMMSWVSLWYLIESPPEFCLLPYFESNILQGQILKFSN